MFALAGPFARERDVRVGAEVGLELIERAVLRLGHDEREERDRAEPKPAYSQKAPCFVIASVSVRKVYEITKLSARGDGEAATRAQNKTFANDPEKVGGFAADRFAKR